MSAEMMVISEDIRKTHGLFCWNKSLSICVLYPDRNDTPSAGFSAASGHPAEGAFY
ncbi:hypothetical protein [uncultured Dialister sp.]|jgi:hypothetical protein|uniref:hypothetical protein n=1 Tax=uncultured Dialister sp. TaxID=278064 RepID=UPI0025E0CC89|nr:hypothetical protein [uncultured Dialister sp.]